MEAVHCIASSYGWTRDYILDNLYVDEIFSYMRVIKVKELNDIKMMAFAVSIPHTKNPKATLKEIDSALKELQGNRIIDEVDNLPNTTELQKAKALFGKKRR